MSKDEGNGREGSGEEKGDGLEKGDGGLFGGYASLASKVFRFKTTLIFWWFVDTSNAMLYEPVW